MKVILRKEVSKLGGAGEVKQVRDGYARNFLIPQGLAEPATEKSLNALSQRLAAHKARGERERSEFQAIAEKLKNTELRFMLKVGEQGQAFGSITAQDIAEKLAEQGIKVEKSWIDLEHGIKTAGEHEVQVKFPHQIVSAVKISIAADA